jgi:hypothetical protein
MIVKMLTHIHMVVYTWWCWHIYKGDEVGVDVYQLGNGTKEGKVQNSTGEVSAHRVRQFDGATGTLYRKDKVS